MRILGLDYGSKTIGVAVSDPFGWTAQGVKTIHRNNPIDVKESIEELVKIIEEYAVEKIVVGLPKNMNNTEGERVELTNKFVELLKRQISIPVELWDERLSTMGAKRILMEANVHKDKHKKVIDKMAAVFILQGYLDAQQ